jgi:tellurite resistance protein TehA-like permease
LTLGTSLPIILNPSFFQTSLGYNLPRFANIILTICLLPLVIIIALDWRLRPDDKKQGLKNKLMNLLQWPLMPLATLAMSTLPGLESHTRLLLGKRLEYKTTPKK